MASKFMSRNTASCLLRFVDTTTGDVGMLFVVYAHDMVVAKSPEDFHRLCDMLCQDFRINNLECLTCNTCSESTQSDDGKLVKVGQAPYIDGLTKRFHSDNTSLCPASAFLKLRSSKANDAEIENRLTKR